MSKLIWDKVGERLYETGVDHGVLYPIQTGGQYNKGVAWNGLSAVTESPSGAEPSPIYADNIKYLNLMSVTVPLKSLLVSLQASRAGSSLDFLIALFLAMM